MVPDEPRELLEPLQRDCHVTKVAFADIRLLAAVHHMIADGLCCHTVWLLREVQNTNGHIQQTCWNERNHMGRAKRVSGTTTM